MKLKEIYSKYMDWLGEMDTFLTVMIVGVAPVAILITIIIFSIYLVVKSILK